MKIREKDQETLKYEGKCVVCRKLCLSRTREGLYACAGDCFKKAIDLGRKADPDGSLPRILSKA